MRSAVFALLLLCPLSAQAKEIPSARADTPTRVPAQAGQGYLAAREAMLQSGWAGGPSPNDRDRCGIGFDDICARFGAEVVTCRGTGTAGCTFVFWKGDAIAQIQTVGEEIEMQRVVRAHVLSERERRRLRI